MTKSELRKLSQSTCVTAAIVSDGCRDYVVELIHANGAGLLRNWRGKTLRFASLSEAKRAVRYASHILLRVRVAADEACTETHLKESGFSDLPITKRVA